VAFAGHSLGRLGWQVRSGAGAPNPHRAALIKTQELVFERFFNDWRVFCCRWSKYFKKNYLYYGQISLNPLKMLLR